MLALYPSLINADLLNLAATIAQLDPYCAGYHIDIMDNHFVPNLTWGPAFANAIARATNRQIWVHIMADNPESIISKLVLPPKSIVSFHIESNSNKKSLVRNIKNNSWISSVAIAPKTSIDELLTLIPMVDQVLVMSVNPGASGQQFMASAMNRFAQVKSMIATLNPACFLAADGGVNEYNLRQLAELGVDQVGLASALFDYPNPAQRLQELVAL